MTLSTGYKLDPRYKFRFPSQVSEKTQSGLTRTTLREKIYQDIDLDTIPDRITEKITVNGKTTTLLTDTLQARRTATSPSGRTASSFYDPVTLLTKRIVTPGLHDTTMSHDGRGRLTAVATDTRATRLGYDDRGNLSSLTDPEGRTTLYTHDAAGRIARVDLPDLTSLLFSYDLNGNMTVLTTPSGMDHGFSFNGVNLGSSYDTPVSGSYTYSYDRDRRLTSIRFPSGKEIGNIFDKGRLVRTETPEGEINLSYSCGTKVESVARGAETITYGYDGSLVTSVTLSGTLEQTLTTAYNADFKSSRLTHSGASVDYAYDNDGLLTRAGDFTIARDASNGLPLSVSGPSLGISRIFNGFAEMDGSRMTVNTIPVQSYTLNRNKAGKITSKTSTLNGATTEYSYTYDDLGRLKSVTKDGTLVESYDYGPNGTRTTETNLLRGIPSRSFTYSEEDHLLTAGDTTYEYDVDGFLTTRTQGSQVTRYVYSSRGELLSVTLPDGRLIEYVHDPLGRRIAKKVDGAITEKYLWQDMTRLLAVYDGSDNLVQRFQYADARMPVAVTQGGSTHYLSYDQVGSLNLVTDAAGAVVKQIDYDSFGNILSETNPSFEIPFGFAGGLFDSDTGLVRFGFRDYDPDVGRWTAKDPIFFMGGDTNLYGYVLNDPVNRVDPWGLAPGDPYSTLIEAGIDAIQDINPTSIQQGIEYGGRLYQNPDGTYSYTQSVIQGLRDDVNVWTPIPQDTTGAGDYHTHGRADPCYNNEDFSKPDKRTNDTFGYPGFLGTPSGAIKMYTPIPGRPLGGNVIRLR